MAKGNRTTSTPRGASVANATLAAVERIYRLEDKAAAEAFGLGHLAELMELFGDHVGTPPAVWSNLDMQQIGSSSVTLKQSASCWAICATRPSNCREGTHNEAP
jgi:hypothetical protein